MTITRNFKLCLNAGTQNAPYINVNQYDEGEQWIFDLYTEGGQKFTPSTGAIIGIKSDGNAILNSGTVNSDGQVVITETQQMTAASGLAVFELLIEGETHGTANFIVNVERRPSDDAEFSDSDLSMLQEAIDAAEVINEILDEGGDPSEIITENVNNWLDNHPEATTTVEDGAITAPKINNSLWDKILVNEEASGNPASFEDGADDVPVSSLKVALEPIQTGSGDPSPTNIRPISGHSSVTVKRTGKNLLPLIRNAGDTETKAGVVYAVNADGSIDAVGTSTASNSYWSIGTVALKTGNYILTGCPSGGSSNSYYIAIRKNAYNGTLIGRDTGNGFEFELTEETQVYVALYCQSGTVADFTFYPMIRLASDTDVTYEPYTSNTYTIDLNSTVYGGTVDFATGVLTVTWGTITLDGSEAWGVGNTNQGFYTNAYTMLKASDYTSVILCDKLKTYERMNKSDYYEATNGITGYNDGSNQYPTQNWIYAKGGGATTPTEFKTWLASNPLTVVYELATPQTINLTPQQISLLTGINYISSSDEVTVTVTLPGWTSLIDPSKIKHDIYDLDAGNTTGRNLAGEMLRDRVAVKEKLNMEFPPMVADDYYAMLNLIKDQFFDVQYYSPFTGGKRIATMYVGDREGEPYYDYDVNDSANNMWTNVKFNFIER